MVAFRCTGRSRGWREDLRHFLTIWYPPLQRRNGDLTFLTFYVLVRLKKTVRPIILFPRTLRKNKRNGVLFMSNRHIFHFRETVHSTPLAVYIGLNSVWSTTTPTYVIDAIAVIFSYYFFLTTKTPSSARKYLKKAFCSVRFTTHSCILN